MDNAVVFILRLWTALWTVFWTLFKILFFWTWLFQIRPHLWCWNEKCPQRPRCLNGLQVVELFAEVVIAVGALLEVWQMLIPLPALPLCCLCVQDMWSASFLLLPPSFPEHCRVSPAVPDSILPNPQTKQMSFPEVASSIVLYHSNRKELIANPFL